MAPCGVTLIGDFSGIENVPNKCAMNKHLVTVPADSTTGTMIAVCVNSLVWYFKISIVCKVLLILLMNGAHSVGFCTHLRCKYSQGFSTAWKYRVFGMRLTSLRFRLALYSHNCVLLSSDSLGFAVTSHGSFHQPVFSGCNATLNTSLSRLHRL